MSRTASESDASDATTIGSTRHEIADRLADPRSVGAGVLRRIRCHRPTPVSRRSPATTRCRSTPGRSRAEVTSMSPSYASAMSARLAAITSAPRLPKNRPSRRLPRRAVPRGRGRPCSRTARPAGTRRRARALHAQARSGCGERALASASRVERGHPDPPLRRARLAPSAGSMSQIDRRRSSVDWRNRVPPSTRPASGSPIPNADTSWTGTRSTWSSSPWLRIGPSAIVR